MTILFDDGPKTVTAWGPNGLGVVKLGIPVERWLLVDENDAPNKGRHFTPEDGDSSGQALMHAVPGRDVKALYNRLRYLRKLRLPGPAPQHPVPTSNHSGTVEDVSPPVIRKDSQNVR